MNDVEHRFLSRIIHDGASAVAEARESGITVGHFGDPDFGRIWEFVYEYSDEYGMLPSLRDIEFQTDIDWEPDEPEDALPRLVHLLKESRSYGLFVEAVAEAKKKAKGREMSEAWSIIKQGADQADEEHGVLHPVNVHDDWVDWLERYRKEEGIVGYPTGYPTIDYGTGGLQEEQLVTIVGPPKAGKSTLTLNIADFINRQLGRRVLFCTFEMSVDEQRRRLACMVAGVNYEDFLQKRLPPREFRRMAVALRQIESSLPDFIIASDATAGSTVGSVAALARKHDPHVIFIDGVYLMDSEVPQVESMDPKALTALTRNLKRLAQNLKKPVVITHQVLESRYSKKKGIQSKDIGYASSFAQDSDIVFGIETTDNPRENRMSIVLARNAALRHTMLAWEWDTSSFEEIEGYSEAAVDFDFEEDDEDGDEP